MAGAQSRRSTGCSFHSRCRRAGIRPIDSHAGIAAASSAQRRTHNRLSRLLHHTALGHREAQNKRRASVAGVEAVGRGREEQGHCSGL